MNEKEEDEGLPHQRPAGSEADGSDPARDGEEGQGPRRALRIHGW